MKIAQTLSRNIVFVWLGFACHVATTLFLTPLMISELGHETYGLWIFLQTLIGYYGLIDIGLRAGVTQTVTRKVATGNPNDLTDFLNGTLPLLWKIAFGIVAIGLIAALILPFWIKIQEVSSPSLSLIIVMQSAGVAFTFCFFPFSAILPGMQRYDLSETIAITTKLLSAAATYVILTNTPNLVSISLSILTLNIVDQITRIYFAFRLIPGIKRVRPSWDTSQIKELVKVGGWNFLLQISHLLLQSFHVILAGILFSLESIVPFSLAKSLAEYCNRLVGLSSRVLYPMFVYLDSNGGRSKSRELFFATCRISISFSGVILVFGSLWLSEFLDLWLRNVSDRQPLIEWAKFLFIIFSITLIFENLRGVASQFVVGRNELEFLGKTMLIEAGLSIAMAILLGTQLGLVGIALGNLIAYVFTTFFLHIPKYNQMFDMPYHRTIINLFQKPTYYLLFVGVTLVIINMLTVKKDSISYFVGYRIAPTVVSCLLYAPVLFTKPQLSYFCKFIDKTTTPLL